MEVPPEELEKFNLKVLQKSDPYVTHLLFPGAHVATYSFDPETENWVSAQLHDSLILIFAGHRGRERAIIYNTKVCFIPTATLIPSGVWNRFMCSSSSTASS